MVEEHTESSKKVSIQNKFGYPVGSELDAV